MPSDTLKLAALEETDLAVLSAHVQDGVFKVADILWSPANNQLIVPMNRFVWEQAVDRKAPNERRRAALQFDRVTALRSQGIVRADGERVLSLLAIVFRETEPPAGTITLICSGEAALRLEVECIEARLTDLGAAWSASARPRHAAGR